MFQLRDGHWKETKIFTQPGEDDLVSMTTVGNLVVGQVHNYRTKTDELRVIR